MANQEHLDILKQGRDVWSKWREQHHELQPQLNDALLRESDLSMTDLNNVFLHNADLTMSNLSGANLSRAWLTQAHLRLANLSNADLSNTHLDMADLGATDLSNANLSNANLIWVRTHDPSFFRNANLRKAILTLAFLSMSIFTNADLNGASLIQTDLSNADLRGANLKEADLSGANLTGANLSGADLSNANLSGSILVETNLTRANLTGCFVYGIAVWNVELDGAKQDGLIITPKEKPIITVDNLKIAQFIYLLLDNKEIRDIIDTITSKVVLILGRFTSERKAILDALRNELRKHNYSPVLFDFEKPASRDLTETVGILAHLARFIIVDLTDPSSAPHEVATVISHTVVPVQPLLWRGPLVVDGKVVERREYAMFEDLRRRYHWVLPTYRYQDTAELLAYLQAQIIAPAEQKAKELKRPK